MPHIQVNKLIGDLHKQFLEQGSNKVILAFSLPFSIVSAKEALENVNLSCATLRSSGHSNPDHWVLRQVAISARWSISIFKYSCGIAQFHRLPNPRLDDFNPVPHSKTYHILPGFAAWQWFSKCNIGVRGWGVGGGYACCPPSIGGASPLILHIWLLMQIVSQQDKVNSRKQPFSPKSSIAVRLLCYLKNRFELHAICGRQSTPMEGGY